MSGLSDSILKSVGPVAGLVLGLLLGLYVLSSDPLGGGCRTVRDTVVVTVKDTLHLPPDTVWAKTKPLHDTVWVARVDSIIESGANKDSVIRRLAEPQTTQVRFHTNHLDDQTDSTLQVSCLVLVDYFPLDRELKVIHQIDTLTLPVRTEYIREITTVEVASPEVVVWSVVGGVVVGLGLALTF